MQELVSAVVQKTPIVALIEPETKRGGLCCEEVRKKLLAADDLYDKWGFNHHGPRGQQLYEALFEGEPIEWNHSVCQTTSNLSMWLMPLVWLYLSFVLPCC